MRVIPGKTCVAPNRTWRRCCPYSGFTSFEPETSACPAVLVLTASRGDRSVEIKETHVFHMRDGKVVEFWNASTDQYAFDELIG